MPIRQPRGEGWFGRADLHEFVLSERQRREAAAALAEQSAAALHRSREAALARSRSAARLGEPPALGDDAEDAEELPLLGEELPAGYFLG